MVKAVSSMTVGWATIMMRAKVGIHGLQDVWERVLVIIC